MALWKSRARAARRRGCSPSRRRPTRRRSSRCRGRRRRPRRCLAPSAAPRLVEVPEVRRGLVAGLPRQGRVGEEPEPAEAVVEAHEHDAAPGEGAAVVTEGELPPFTKPPPWIQSITGSFAEDGFSGAHTSRRGSLPRAACRGAPRRRRRAPACSRGRARSPRAPRSTGRPAGARASGARHRGRGVGNPLPRDDAVRDGARDDAARRAHFGPGRRRGACYQGEGRQGRAERGDPTSVEGHAFSCVARRQGTTWSSAWSVAVESAPTQTSNASASCTHFPCDVLQ